MSKRTQKESSEERVTAKSRPMMSLIARAPSALSSSASERPGKRSYESQSPVSNQAEKYDRTVKPFVGRDISYEPSHHHRVVESTYSASYSGWDDDKAWSSQEWKADELMDDGTGKPVVCPQRGTHAFQSRFSREHKHVILEEENHSDNWHSIANTKDRTLKQMFDTSEKLISEQSDEIYGVKTINWEDSSWKYLSLIGDEQVISLQRTKDYVFSDSVLLSW